MWLLNNRENKSFPYKSAPNINIKPPFINDKTNLTKFNLNTFYSNIFTQNLIKNLQYDPKYLETYYSNVTLENNNVKLSNMYGYVINALNTITFIYPEYINPLTPKIVTDNLYKNNFNTNITELYWTGKNTSQIKLWRSKQV